MAQLLLTGGGGYVGSHVLLQLIEAGHDVVVLDQAPPPPYFKETFSEKNWICGDMGDENLLSTLFKEHTFKGVFHFAASISVFESTENPLLYFENNLTNTLKIVRSSLEAGVKKMVFSSTAAVYGEVEEGLVGEQTEPKPINPYGHSKLMAEKALQNCARAYGFESVILRYFNVAGADPKGRIGPNLRNASHLIGVCLRAASGEISGVEVFGDDYPTRDGSGVRDFIHIEDLSKAHLLGWDYLEKGGKTEIFNVGYGQGFSVKEVIASVKKVTGQDFEVKIVGRRPGDPAQVIADPGKIKNELSWQPTLNDLDRIIESAWLWQSAQSGAKA